MTTACSLIWWVHPLLLQYLIGSHGRIDCICLKTSPAICVRNYMLLSPWIISSEPYKLDHWWLWTLRLWSSAPVSSVKRAASVAFHFLGNRDTNHVWPNEPLCHHMFAQFSLSVGLPAYRQPVIRWKRISCQKHELQETVYAVKSEIVVMNYLRLGNPDKSRNMVFGVSVPIYFKGPARVNHIRNSRNRYRWLGNISSQNNLYW